MFDTSIRIRLGPPYMLYLKDNKVWIQANSDIKKFATCKVKHYDLLSWENENDIRILKMKKIMIWILMMKCRPKKMIMIKRNKRRKNLKILMTIIWEKLMLKKMQLVLILTLLFGDLSNFEPFDKISIEVPKPP